MTTTIVGVVRETAPGEHRVALTPDTVASVAALGMATVVARNAGAPAWWPDSAYRAAGARIADQREVSAGSDVLLCVDGAQPSVAEQAHAGQVLVGLLRPLLHPALVARWRDDGVTAVSLDLLPNTLIRARPMDAVASQAVVAGYKAAVLAANTYGGFLPVVATAAGTTRPARVLVFGPGVTASEAANTTRRMGALVTNYDLRSVALQESPAQQDDFAEWIGGFDIVITTAQTPGRKPPVLVTEDAVHRMRPGSVIVDLAAGPLGGNVEGAEADTTVVLAPGVVVIGAGNLPAGMAPAASASYARNITALLANLARDGRVAVDLTEIQAAAVVTHQGTVVNSDVARLLEPTPAAG